MEPGKTKLKLAVVKKDIENLATKKDMENMTGRLDAQGEEI